ncbi:hypothetical protein GOP47_0024457 [Adiantum capillus-veneris]|uniref:Peroxidase n=2 Tax=Adiantum capillus-veneris TaxID=13818 RepID=A0A9D4Z4E3_ADICA|nr:hypothetical protein GOP47_0024457 [Adiantum capillus-veneris]
MGSLFIMFEPLKLVILLALLHLGTLQHTTSAQTQVGFYDTSCPNAEAIVRSTVTTHIQSDVTIAAGLVRLFFHDCFVQGCDGSVLISGGNAVERAAPANAGVRGFEVVEDAKAQLEATCPGVVSCADILALAAKDAVDLSEGPSWHVPLGRRDGRVSLASNAANMPSPSDSIATLKQKFAAKGLSVQDLVVLSGAHTIGQTDCRFFSYRLYNYSLSNQFDPSIDSSFLGQLQQLCPPQGNGLAKVALDTGSQTSFDTSFFKNVNKGFGVLESDQRLMSDPTTSSYVKRYGGLVSGLLGVRFDLAFANSMVKMGNIGVLTGSKGEIRRACSSVN